MWKNDVILRSSIIETAHFWKVANRHIGIAKYEQQEAMENFVFPDEIKTKMMKKKG